MKRIVLLITVTLLAATQAFALRNFPATGQVVDEQGQAVEYATVVLMKNGSQVAGMATDTQGRFELKVPAGDYTLSIQYLGFDPLTRTVQVEHDNDLGQFVMKNAATQIEGVVVKGQLIRREADRFVVNVANTPAAMGKDGIELLEHAPGVWIDGEKITINGKSGSKVYVNDRELRMQPEQLLTYLRTLRAEEIQKIEVVPIAGADYDADSSGGIIKITLTKRRENGTNGSVSMRTSQGEYVSAYNPGADINIHSGRVDINASAWGYLQNQKIISNEQTRYTTSDTRLRAHSEMDERSRNYGATIGSVVELNPRHSVGAEFEYWTDKTPGENETYTDFTSGGNLTRTDSRYDTQNKQNNYSATFNYIWRIDSLGSTLKLLADYTRRENSGFNGYHTRTTPPSMPARDSLYRDNSSSLYNIVSATLALEKNFSPRWALKAGLKFTNNDMQNDALYQYRKDDAWVVNNDQTFSVDYTENIAAAYSIASAKLGRLSLVAGLRAEYTHTDGKQVGQDYLSLFPNANLSYSLSKDGAYSLIAQYARTIERPRFWQLNPQRLQISDYTYQIGNPELDPAFSQDMSLTFVLKHKYTLTAGVTLQSGEVNQDLVPDPQNPDILAARWINYDKTKSYYFSANLPFQFTKWWSLNANATYARRGQRLEKSAPETFSNVIQTNVSTTFILPAKFFIDLSYAYQNKIVIGNLWVEPTHRLQAGIKKQFGERFTASFSVRNMLDQAHIVGANGNGFTRTVKMKQNWNSRDFRIGLTYKFKSGKAFKAKSIEAGASDEKNRL